MQPKYTDGKFSEMLKDQIKSEECRRKWTKQKKEKTICLLYILIYISFENSNIFD